MRSALFWLVLTVLLACLDFHLGGRSHNIYGCIWLVIAGIEVYRLYIFSTIRVNVEDDCSKVKITQDDIWR